MAKIQARKGLVPVKKQVKAKTGTKTITYWVKPDRAKAVNAKSAFAKKIENTLKKLKSNDVKALEHGWNEYAKPDIGHDSVDTEMWEYLHEKDPDGIDRIYDASMEIGGPQTLVLYRHISRSLKQVKMAGLEKFVGDKLKRHFKGKSVDVAVFKVKGADDKFKGKPLFIGKKPRVSVGIAEGKVGFKASFSKVTKKYWGTKIKKPTVFMSSNPARASMYGYADYSKGEDVAHGETGTMLVVDAPEAKLLEDVNKTIYDKEHGIEDASKISPKYLILYRVQDSKVHRPDDILYKARISRKGLVPIKKKVKTGAIITFWVRPEKAKKIKAWVKPVERKEQKTEKQEISSLADIERITKTKSSFEEAYKYFSEKQDIPQSVASQFARKYMHFDKKGIAVQRTPKEAFKAFYDEITEVKIPVKGLNKDIDFKANEKFLNNEISGEHKRQLNSLYKDKKATEFKIKENRRLLEEAKAGKLPVPYTKEQKEEFDKQYRLETDILNVIKEDIVEMESKTYMKKFEDFAQNLTPVHSLSPDKFKRVLQAGGLKSLEELGETGKQSGYAFIESKIRPEFGDDISEEMYALFDEQGMKAPWTFDKYKKLNDLKFGINTPHDKREKFNDTLKGVSDIAQAETKGAIGNPTDKAIGTDKHVFSVLGSNGNGSGYGDISIVMKQDIMEHPDFNMTPVAGTSFMSGEVYNHREWTKPRDKKDAMVGDTVYIYGYENKIRSINKEKDIISFINKDGQVNNDFTYDEFLSKNEEFRLIDSEEHFHKSKLNAGQNLEYWKYMAKDISAQGSISNYENKNLHGKWEGHLPAFVPTDQFAEVVTSMHGAERLYTELTGKKITDVLAEVRSDPKFDKDKQDAYDIADKKVREHIQSKMPEGVKLTLFDSSEAILPYMNKGFRNGRWNTKFQKGQKTSETNKAQKEMKELIK
jgi:hypothetical protein